MKISISDHAILRYLERYYNLDINKIKQEILTPNVISAIKAGVKKITINNIEFPIRDGVIVTSIKKERRKLRK